MNCPKCSAPIDRVPLPGGLEVDSCSACSGVFYDAEEIAVPLAFDNAMRSRYICPKCGMPMEAGTLFAGQLTAERCTACGGLWLDAGEVPKLRRLAGTDAILGKPGSAPSATPPMPAPGGAGAGVPIPSPTGGDPPAAAPEVMGDTTKVVSPSPSADEAPEPEDCGAWNNPDQEGGFLPYEEKTYRHFQTSRPVVTFVLGEFNWKVAVGERAVARDFIDPPFILCEDRTGSDSIWSQGTYLEPREVWDGFGLGGEPPMRVGVAPSQPNPHAAELAELKWEFGLFFAASLLVYLGAEVLTGGKAAGANFFWFGLLLAAPPGLIWFQSHTFEVERWQESDHPWAAAGSGNDDDE